LREFQADVAGAKDSQVARKKVDVHDGAVGKVWDAFDTSILGSTTRPPTLIISDPP